MGVDAEMFVRTKYQPNREELLDWHYRFGNAFHGHLCAFGTHENKVPDDLYIFPVDEWTQDGETIHPEPGEVFLRARPKSRYYGPGYERGDFPTIKAMAEFLELLIPGAEIWYGGDSSGICASRFGKAEREEMLHYFVRYGTRPYHGRHDDTPKCAFDTPPTCPYCVKTASQFGFGNGYASFSCLGCGWEHRRKLDHDGKVLTREGWGLKGVF